MATDYSPTRPPRVRYAGTIVAVWLKNSGVTAVSDPASRPAPASFPYRIGIGHDTHRLGPSGPLLLGGVRIEHDRHLIGHSDADVLLHAVTDALLGAAALPDIGELFPDHDPQNRGRDSAEMLLAAKQLIDQHGYQIVNLDCIVFAQRPKISPHKLAIRTRLAELLELPLDRVGLKAKTGELVGPVGREEAIQAECVVLLAGPG
ncbi:MAG: 2-C-methyl-D-erythritol 2,4-cyclodiphosphate synthase [Pirellulales bacterium]